LISRSYTTTNRAGFAHSQQNGVVTTAKCIAFENGERKNFQVLLEQAREMQTALLR
jgi:hypothetical protein